MAAPESVWREALPESAAAWDADDRARALMRAFHDRHVPITPALAVSLAAFERDRYPTRAPTWGKAFEAAGRALGFPTAFGRSTLWAGVQESFHLLVAEPILRAAAVNVGSVCFWGESAVPDVPASDLRSFVREHARRLEPEVDRCLSEDAVMGRPFWLEVALGVVAAAGMSITGHHQLVGRATFGRRTRLPFVADRATARLAFEFEPEFEPEEHRSNTRTIPRRVAERERSGRRPKEGGVAGVTTSRRLEDLQDVLVTELMWPPELVTQRIMEDGVLIRHRPPMRRPRRDMLFLALCDIASDRDAVRFTKAAWGDAALRSSAMLASLGLAKSDLVWAEAHQGRTRSATLKVDALPPLLGGDPMLLAGRERGVRWLQSGLLPHLFDRAPTALLDPNDARALVTQACSEALDALARPTLRLGLLPDDAAHALDAPALAADYRKVVVTHVTRADGPPESRNAIARRRHLLERLALGTQVDRTITHALLLPERLEAGAQFTVVSDLRAFDGAEIEVASGESASERVRRSAGRLVRALVDLTIGAVNA